MSAPRELLDQIAVTALGAMMRQPYFDICVVDTVARMLDVKASQTQYYAALRPLHCLRWAEMPKQVVDAVPHLINSCLGQGSSWGGSSPSPRDFWPGTQSTPQLEETT